MPFSVLMSVYKKEKASHLEDCLNSLERQSLKADEVVLVEDGPIPKELSSTIDKYRTALNIKSVVLKRNEGLAFALNKGLERCSNDIVARMDTDDIACDDRFIRQYSYFTSARPSVCSGIIEEWDENFSKIMGIRRLPNSHDDIVRFSKTRSPISHPACMYNKKDVLDVGGYPKLYPEDHLLWVKMIQNGSSFSNLNEVLVKMRTGKDFQSRRGWLFLKGQLATYRYMYKSNYIGILDYIKACLIMSFVRLSPTALKLFIYRFMR